MAADLSNWDGNGWDSCPKGSTLLPSPTSREKYSERTFAPIYFLVPAKQAKKNKH